MSFEINLNSREGQTKLKTISWFKGQVEKALELYFAEVDIRDQQKNRIEKVDNEIGFAENLTITVRCLYKKKGNHEN